MVPRGKWQGVWRWSVAVAGALVVAVALAQVPGGGDQPVLDVVEVGLPLLVGAGLVAGGLWLRATQSTWRIAEISLWTGVGVVCGVAAIVWFAFVVTLGIGPIGDPVVLVLNSTGIMAATSAVMGYYATGIRQRERRLERSNARFRALTENATFAVVTVDETGTVRYANDAVQDLFGRPPAEVVGEPFAALVADRPGDAGGLAGYGTAGEASVDRSAVEFTGRRADGSEFPVEVSFGEYAEDGDRLFTAVVQDVSDRRDAEARLEKHDEQMTKLHEFATDVAAAETRERICALAARGAANLFACDVGRVALAEDEQLVPAASSRPEPLAGCDPLSATEGFAGESYRHGVIRRVEDLDDTRSAASGGEAAAPANPPESPGLDGGDGRDGATHGDGEPACRSLLSVPLGGFGVLQLFDAEPGAFTESDEEVADLLSTHVVTALERVEAEATVRRERDQLEEFASVLSHDIRNPLNVAQGRLELARETGDDEHFAAAARAQERIRELIDDVLTLARQGQAVGEDEPVVLADVAREAWENVATAEAMVTIDADDRIAADRGRLLQVFENLYQNAVEHGSTNAGSEGVAVTVRRTDEGFVVEDTGPGVPPEERDQVFESGYSTSDEGTGFGLTIVDRIVEAEGWEVSVTESADGGARFEITGVEGAETVDRE